MKKSAFKVKRHRFYKNTLCVSIILVGLSIITLMVLSISGIQLIDPTSLIYDLTNKIANGIDLSNLSLEDLEKYNVEMFTYESNYNGVVYFRYESKGDWVSSKDSFKSAKLNKTTNPNGLELYYDKAENGNSDTYNMDISVKVTTQKEIIPDYSINFRNAKNDCYIAQKKKNEYEISTTFIPDFDYSLAKNTSYSDSKFSSGENKYYEYVKSNYLKVDNSIKDNLISFCEKNNLKADSETVIEDVQNFLKENYTFDLDVPSSEGKDVILFFLEDSKKGIQSNFAGAATMLYRTLGLPARYVNGFVSLSYPSDEPISVKYLNAHAWTEVYIPGSGWFRVDATTDPSIEDLANRFGYGDLVGQYKDYLDNQSSDLSDEIANGTMEGLMGAADEASKVEIINYQSNYSGNIYFRSASRGDWNSSEDKFDSPLLYQLSTSSPLGFYASKASSAKSNTYQIQASVTNFGTNYLYPDYNLTSLESTNDCYVPQKEGSAYSFNMSFMPDFNYEDAKNTNFDSSNLTSAETTYYTFVKQYYLNIEDEMKNRLLSICNENNLNANSPTIIQDVKEFLIDNYTYDLNVPSSEGKDVILFFLEDSKRGVCSNFASAATMIYRALGIPSRYVKGFVSYSLANKNTSVTAQNAHAWTEAYIPGSGWCLIDATGVTRTSENGDLDYSSGDESSTHPSGDDSGSSSDQEGKEEADKYVSINKNISITYDGQTHYLENENTFVVHEDNLPDGVYARKYFSDNVQSVKDAGKYLFNGYVKLFDEDGLEVTKKYLGEEKYGSSYTYSITVKKRNLLIETESKEYTLSSGQTQIINDTEVVVEQESDYSGLVNGHQFSSTFTYEYFELGETINSLESDSIIIYDEDNLDVTSNYSLTLVYGTIEVK